MPKVLTRGSLLVLLSPLLASGADVRFQCVAPNPAYECAFTVFDQGAISFVLDAGEQHGLNETTIGSKYCVNVGPKRVPPNQYPNCWQGLVVRGDVVNTQYPAIGGTWIDRQGLQFTIRVSGQTLIFTGPPKWPTGSGAFTSAFRFNMAWPGLGSFSGTVASDQLHINWSNGSSWTKR